MTEIMLQNDGPAPLERDRDRCHPDTLGWQHDAATVVTWIHFTHDTRRLHFLARAVQAKTQVLTANAHSVLAQ